MRRVVSVWFPTFPTDRLQRVGVLPSAGGPFVTASHDGRRRVVTAVNAVGQGLGIWSGMPLASAQALAPGLGILEVEPEADEAALIQLATWCLRYAPLVAVDAPDGIWIDVTGCTHLAGGEEALLEDLVARFKRAGFTARAAIAGTPGVAHAVARYGGRQMGVVPADSLRDELAPLPVKALRLPSEVIDGLHRLGFERINDLMTAPGAPLVKRLGAVRA